MYFKIFFTIIAVALCATTHAYEVGEKIVKFGTLNIYTKENSDVITLNGASLGDDSGVIIDNSMTASLAFTYMFAEHWGVELVGGIPPTNTVYGQGAALASYGIDKVVETKWAPPTLLFQYYPMSADSKLQPFVAAGLNYTVFFDEEVSPEYEAALGPATAQTESSWGLALQVGVDYQINDRWLFNVFVGKLDIDTTATITSAGGVAEVDVDIDPIVFSANMGYRF